MKKLLLFKNQGLKSILLLGFLFLFSNYSWGQTNVFLETFGTVAGSPYTGGTSITPSSITYPAISSSLATISRISPASDAYLNIVGTSSTTTSRAYLMAEFGSLSEYNISPTLSLNTSVEWTFNMKTSRTTVLSSASNYTDGNYYSAVILASTSSNLISSTTGTNGYAVILTRSATTATKNAVRLVKFTNGIIASSTIVTLKEAEFVNLTRSVSVKVIYTPTGSGAGNWELFSREDASSTFVDPTTGTALTSAGTSTDATYTGIAMTHFGVLASLNTSTSAVNSFQFDNLRISTVNNPTINAPSVSTLSGFTTTNSTESAEQSFTISGRFLTNSIVATAPTGYEVSTTSGGTFGATASLTNAATQSGTIYVRLKSGLSDGSKTGNVTITSTGATTTSSYTVALTGAVSSNPALTSNTATLTQFANTASGANSTSSSFTLSGVNLSSGDVTVTAPTNFTVSTDNTTFANSVSITPNSGGVSSTIYVRYSPTGSGGYSGNVVIAWSGLADQNVAVSGYLSTFYYKAGSTSLATAANWSGTADETGTSLPNDFTTAGVTYQILSSSPTTDAAWIVSGSGSKIIVGNSTVAGVTLTIASSFGITGTIDVAQSNSANTPNKVVVQEYLPAVPTFGNLHDESEVHYQNATLLTVTVPVGATYGKLIIDAGTAAVSFTGTLNTIKKALTVSAGAIAQFSGNSGNWTVINADAVVTINGKLQSSKALGILSFGVTTPALAAASGCLQFVDAATKVATDSSLVLGTTSTVEFNRSTNAQVISVLPPGIKYANLSMTDSGKSANKTIASTITVDGILTVAQFVSTITGNITMGDGAKIVMAGTNGFTTVPTFGTSVNLSYTPIKMPAVITTVSGQSTGTLSVANNNITAGLAVSGTGIPDGTTVVSYTQGSTSIVLSNAATISDNFTIIFDKYLSQTSGNEIPTTTTVLNNLTINNPAGVTLSVSTTANGVLNLISGKLVTGTNFVTIGTSGSITGAGASTGWVVGYLIKQTATNASPSFDYAIGDTTNYTPISLTFSGVNTASTAGSITASTTSSDHVQVASSGLDNANSVNRTWTLLNNGVTGFTDYSATLNYAAADNDASSVPANYVVRKYNASAWLAPTTSATPSATSATASGLVDFGDFAVGASSGAPTVTLQPIASAICDGIDTSFSASAASSALSSSIKWQRSTNGSVWSDITANLDAGTTYSNFTTGTLALTGSAAGLNNYQYRAVFTSINGSANSNAAALTVNSTAAPTASAQSFCNSGTVAELMASGTGLQWYSVATNGPALASTTALATGDYFVSQTLNGCEGPRTSVAVTVNTTAAPTGDATQTLSSSLTISSIVVTGTNVVWYATSENAAAGLEPLPNTTPLTNTTYFATQTVGGCTSLTSLAVTITTTLANQDFELDSIKIFPNPSTGNFVTITSSIHEDIDVEVFDILGKHILTQKVISNILDVSDLHSGMYLLKIPQKERTTIKKLVIK